MSAVLRERFRTAFAPPRYLARTLSGVDLSASSVKAVRLAEGPHGLILAKYALARLPVGAFSDGEIVDQVKVSEAITAAAETTDMAGANVAVPESKSYLFETTASGRMRGEWRTVIEQRLDELVPLPPNEVVFDVVGVGTADNGDENIVGIGLAQRIINSTLDAFDAADIPVTALEGEMFSIARALLPFGDQTTTLIIDIGKTTTKLCVVAKDIPRFATTVGIGGHALTLAVQKHFGVTEAEARRVKLEHGIVPAPGNEDYLAAMLSTISAIRDEIKRWLDYWQEKVSTSKEHEPVARVIIAGGNASVRGLSEYLESALRIPVTTGDVFTNFTSREIWLPPLDYNESLAYATAIGLALRDHEVPL